MDHALGHFLLLLSLMCPLAAVLFLWGVGVSNQSGVDVRDRGTLIDKSLFDGVTQVCRRQHQ